MSTPGIRSHPLHTGRLPSVVVVGSVNLDLVLSAPRLPQPGETVSDARLQRHPGGKGANQALAARRLGAEVALVAKVGRDAAADEALVLLQREGVDLARCRVDEESATGIASIVVAPNGENQIVVAPGANRALTPDVLELPPADALLCQLEIPMDTIAAAAAVFRGFFCLNLAPARTVPRVILHRADLIVMNETEADRAGDSIVECGGLLATTYGAEGAILTRHGKELARARPPSVRAIDTTGAGDVFTAALTVGLIEGRPADEALAFACAAGAFATTKPGAQPSFPRRDEVDTLRSRA